MSLNHGVQTRRRRQSNKNDVLTDLEMRFIVAVEPVGGVLTDLGMMFFVAIEPGGSKCA